MQAEGQAFISFAFFYVHLRLSALFRLMGLEIINASFHLRDTLLVGSNMPDVALTVFMRILQAVRKAAEDARPTRPIGSPRLPGPGVSPTCIGC